METKIHIKETTEKDFDDIMLVQERAFGMKKEAILTAEMLADETAKPYLSLMAYDKDRPVGHIIFTRVYMNNREIDQALVHILAPLGIIPEYQSQGIGGLLIKEGLEILKERNSEAVFVLGHIGYYDRFGFIPDAKKLGYNAPFPIPEEFKDAWMIQSLNDEGFVIDQGQVICCDELHKPEHWRE